MNSIKTVLLMGILFGLCMFFGGLFGGRNGVVIAFFVALVFNGVSYWFSDSIVLSMYRAKELSPSEAPELHEIVARVAAGAGIPKPRVVLVPMPVPNAFATGRDPDNAVVAVTRALVEMLDRTELEGVIAHEISHIKNRDTLIQCLAAAMGGAIVMLSYTARFAAFFGLGRDDDNNVLELLILAVLAPIAALLIQMAISRSREFAADEMAARITHNPYGLSNALRKLESVSQRYSIRGGNSATSHLFIVNPFRGGMASLFSTHPSTEQRIQRLENMQF
ncbi:MAG TPA: zinc metalloprotease HtpX [bacterium]|nr:zinc metalloprotease HtpX [bacterium]